MLGRRDEQSDWQAAVGLEQYRTQEKLAEKPKKEALVQEVERSKAFIEAVRGRYGDAIDELVAELEGIVYPEQGQGKVVSFIDLQAWHGVKSRRTMFSGYKVHIAEDESEIVTSCDLLSGNRNEGHELPHLLQLEDGKGIKSVAVVADALYDSGENRQLIHQGGMKAYIPFRGKRKWSKRFAYLPQEDRVECMMGNKSIGKITQQRGKLHYFSAEDCRRCQRYEDCARKNQPRMTIWVSDSYRQSLVDDGEDRRTALGIRRMIERKFGEAKKWHGMARARYRGLWRVKIQALMTFIVINLKRLTRLQGQKGGSPGGRRCRVPT